MCRWLRPGHATRAAALHCGTCGTCVERREAFALAGIADPPNTLGHRHERRAPDRQDVQVRGSAQPARPARGPQVRPYPRPQLPGRGVAGVGRVRWPYRGLSWTSPSWPRWRAHINATFDHRDLNTVLDDPPTSEHLARYFYTWCDRASGAAGGRAGGEGAGLGDRIHLRRVRTGTAMTAALLPARPLLVAETFGPTFQGEGTERRAAGVVPAAVAVQPCRARAATRPTRGTQPGLICASTRFGEPPTRSSNGCWGYRLRLLVITGGEPMLQQDVLLPVVAAVACRRAPD